MLTTQGINISLERDICNDRIDITFEGRSIQFFIEKNSLESTENVIDLYPLNGTVKNHRFKIGDFVRKVHREEIEQHSKIAQSLPGPRCIVVDFKDSNVRYENKEEIARTEQSFSSFFKGPEPKEPTQKAIHRLFSESSIGYCIYEGSLKADLIKKSFIQEEGDFLQTNEGSALFCQLCEIIMNSFKMGCRVTDSKGVLYMPSTYIEVLKEPSDTFCGKNLYTFYPKVYQDTYSATSRYFRLIQNLYSAEHHVDEKERTCIIIR